jgi:hypothetical protein
MLQLMRPTEGETIMSTNTVTFDKLGGHIPIDKCGRILSPRLWAQLAAEYFDGTANSRQALDDADLLGRYVDARVQYAGWSSSHWAEVYSHLGKKWKAVEVGEPYGGFDDLERAWLDDDVVQVSNLYCDHPVWDEDTNVRFRIWHDTGHVLANKGFDPDGELDLFAIQSLELSPALQAALFSESVYQLAACIALGGFPDVQQCRTPGPVGRLVLQLLQERYK